MQKKKPKRILPAAARRRRAATAQPRRRRSSEDILNRIVQAATGEFKRYGFAGATTASIARKAEVTEAQLFRYFGSKSNLFRETIFKPLDQLLSNFIDRHLQSESRAPLQVMADLNTYVEEFQQFITEHAGMLTSLVVAQIYDHGDAQGVGEINSLRTFFERGSTELTITLGDDAQVDPRLLVRLSFVTVLAAILFRNWIFPPALADEKDIRDAINHFIMHGFGMNIDRKLLARRGRK